MMIILDSSMRKIRGSWRYCHFIAYICYMFMCLFFANLNIWIDGVLLELQESFVIEASVQIDYNL